MLGLLSSELNTRCCRKLLTFVSTLDGHIFALIERVRTSSYMRRSNGGGGGEAAGNSG